MRKSDVTFHSDGYREGHAAVNVKVQDWPTRTDVYAYGVAERCDPRFTEAWIDEHLTEDERSEWWNSALENEWEHLDDEAENVFGQGYHTHGEGRSGGWAIVCHSLGQPNRHFAQFSAETVETWDAIALGHWARFAKWARMHADDVPYQYVDLIYHNVFDPWAEHADAVADRLAAYVAVPA